MTRPAWRVAALVGLALLGLPTQAGAQDPPSDRCRPTDIIFLIDDSYSFGNAHDQRRTFAKGIQAFLEPLGEQHQVSLVSFGTEASTLVTPTANTAEARAEIGRQIGAMRFRAPWTNVYAGLDQAFRWMAHDRDRRGVIVLVSDGVISMPDPNRPGSNAESDEAKTEQLRNIRLRLPDVVERGGAIYTLAYENDKTDYALMKEIADKTAGIAQAGNTETLPAVMAQVASEMCTRDPVAAQPKPQPRVAAAPPAAAPPAAAPPAAAPPAPAAPAPVTPVAGAAGAAAGGAAGASPLLWFAVAGAGLAVVGASVVASRRGRRRRAAVATAGGAAPAGGWTEMSPEPAITVASAATRERAGRVERTRPKGDDPSEQFFSARRGTMSLEAIPEPAVPKRAARGGAAPSSARSAPPDPGTGAAAAAAAAPSARDLRAAGTTGARPAIVATAAASAASGGRPRGVAPPPKPGWQEDHMVRVVGYTAGGKVLKESDFRRSGEIIVAIGLGAGAVLDVPPDKGHVRGSFRFTVDPDGTRVVTIHDLPPGGFRDKDTGRALREGDRLTNNLRIEWAREERGRYLEVLLK